MMVWWGVDRESGHQASRRYQPSITRANHSIACTLSTPPHSCRRLMHPGVWHMRSNISGYLARRSNACRARMLHTVEGWRIIIVGWAKHKQTIRIDTLGGEWRQPLERYRCHIAIWCSMSTLSRFYRCSITDVYMGLPMFTSIVVDHSCCLYTEPNKC